ncbi:MAG: hypothetical protein ACK5AL_05265 [Planctomycetota bacterium]|jgi:hypothetical protein
MRYALAFTVLLAAAPLAAQNYWFPSNTPTTGTCNAIPFGTASLGGFSNCRMQLRFTAAELGGVANLITGLGFAPCGTGRANFGALRVVVDHIPAQQSLSTTFDANLTPAAVTVLAGANYGWNVTADTWNEIGLQTFFVCNGVDDVIVDITTTAATSPGSFRRDVRPRLIAFTGTGPVPATGSISNTGTKIEVSMLMARTSSHGAGCAGGNGVPALGFTGSAQMGGAITFQASNGLPAGIGLLAFGFTNAAPYPFDLGVLGAPGCSAYSDQSVTAALLLGPTGAAALPLAIPANLSGFRFFTQFAALDLGANAFGFTTSNYLNVLTGN